MGRWLLLLSSLLIGACTLSLLGAPGAGPAATAASSVTHIPQSATIGSTAVTQPGQTNVPAQQGGLITFCGDPRPRALIAALEKAISTEDGALLAELVSPLHGMDARLLRDGRVVNYDRQHAAALFGSTYAVDWGNAPGSGLPMKGSFRDLVVPDLLDVFSKPYTLQCNQIQTGGTTYSVQWPYEGIDFYSVHYSGSAANGHMDWHTWVLGMHMVADKAYLYAMMQFKWEP